MYAASVLKSMLGETTTGVIPTELLTTDRIMQRWRVANGSGLPTERWDDSRMSQVPPLDDDSASVMDEIVNRLPPKTGKIIVLWYCTPVPTEEIARRAGMTKRSLEKAWVLSLGFLKYKIEGTSHPTLLKLLRIHV